MLEFAIVMLLLGPTPETTKHVLIADHLTDKIECQRMADRLQSLAALARRPDQVYICEQKEK